MTLKNGTTIEIRTDSIYPKTSSNVEIKLDKQMDLFEYSNKQQQIKEFMERYCWDKGTHYEMYWPTNREIKQTKE